MATDRARCAPSGFWTGPLHLSESPPVDKIPPLLGDKIPPLLG